MSDETDGLEHGKAYKLRAQLRNLLAVIHRDGGQRQDEIGDLAEAVRDGERVVTAERGESAEWKRKALSASEHPVVVAYRADLAETQAALVRCREALRQARHFADNEAKWPNCEKCAPGDESQEIWGEIAANLGAALTLATTPSAALDELLFRVAADVRGLAEGGGLMLSDLELRAIVDAVKAGK